MCACLESFGLYVDPNAAIEVTTQHCTSIGLVTIFIGLVIYSIFDRFVYEHEYRSIWTPYLFIVYAFICPPWRALPLIETDVFYYRTNYYLLWTIFTVVLFMFCIRIYRQLRVRCVERKKKTRISSQIEQITTGAATQ
jgi:succinate-acetate transporter protein